MANLNTIAAYVAGTGRNQLATLSGDLSTATAAVVNTDAGTTTVAVLGVPLQTSILGSANPRQGNSSILGTPHFNGGVPRGFGSLPHFTSDSFEGIPFRVRAHGTALMGANAAQSLLISLTLGTSATIGSNVLVGTTGAALAGVAGGTYTFSIVAELIWSIGVGGNGNVAGRHSATISFLPTPTRQVVSDVITSTAAIPAAAATNLKFVVFATAGNSAASTVSFKEFTIELV